ncbi:hypothetical protein [Mesorhizobium sp. B4-1-4]|uniref:hypothetical protein n=1 Tax=Mesorhizobium sp. B4-1-4 TaxID=2589888 RepID=UPI0015E43570|nr:hypothetical protein [Mesorhizobium sp. B4-1-4]UCI29741.1 hypothetical protein FJW03_18075 [Mesorhizobium sp. B4-1-4]
MTRKGPVTGLGLVLVTLTSNSQVPAFGEHWVGTPEAWTARPPALLAVGGGSATGATACAFC